MTLIDKFRHLWVFIPWVSTGCFKISDTIMIFYRICSTNSILTCNTSKVLVRSKVLFCTFSGKHMDVMTLFVASSEHACFPRWRCPGKKLLKLFSCILKAARQYQLFEWCRNDTLGRINLVNYKFAGLWNVFSSLAPLKTEGTVILEGQSQAEVLKTSKRLGHLWQNLHKNLSGKCLATSQMNAAFQVCTEYCGFIWNCSHIQFR